MLLSFFLLIRVFGDRINPGLMVEVAARLNVSAILTRSACLDALGLLVFLPGLAGHLSATKKGQEINSRPTTCSELPNYYFS